MRSLLPKFLRERLDEKYPRFAKRFDPEPPKPVAIESDPMSENLFQNPAILQLVDGVENEAVAVTSNEHEDNVIDVNSLPSSFNNSKPSQPAVPHGSVSGESLVPENIISTIPSHQRLINHIIKLQMGLSNITPLAPKPAYPTSPQKSRSKNELKNFRRFSYLPAEIRLQIWSHNLPQPNVLAAMYDTRYRTHKKYTVGGWTDFGTWCFQNKMENPFVNLSICQESRFEALKYGRLESYEIVRIPDNFFDRSWFNFDTDTFLITTNANIDRDMKIFRPEDPPFTEVVCHKLKFLGIESSFWFQSFGDGVDCDRYPGFGDVQKYLRFRKHCSLWLESLEKVFLDHGSWEECREDLPFRLKVIAQDDTALSEVRKLLRGSVEKHFVENNGRVLQRRVVFGNMEDVREEGLKPLVVESVERVYDFE